MRDRLQSIQALRFLAAAAVVYHHAAIQARAVAGSAGLLAPLDLPGVGAAGVDVFFVISGLVIALTGPLSQPRPTAAAFFWRRWSRVAPVFWVTTIPTILLLGRGLDWPRTLATLAFWPVSGSGYVAPYVGVGWTLCFEMVFYSAVALTLIGGRLRRNLVLAVPAITLLIALQDRSLAARFLVNPMMLEFLAGIGLAFALKRLRRLPPAFGLGLIIAALALFLGLAVVGSHGILEMQSTLDGSTAVARLIWCGIPALMLVAGALICEPAFHSNGLLRQLAKWGDASYSVYLGHALALLALFDLWRFLPKPSADFVIVFGTALGIASGFALYRCVERPLLKATRALRLRHTIEADDRAVGERAGV